MKATIAAALVGLAALVAAKDSSDLPECARTCGRDLLPAECNIDCSSGIPPYEPPTKCNLVNLECVCTNESLLADIACCVVEACSPEEQNLYIEVTNDSCHFAGVTSVSQSAVCAPITTTTSMSATSTPTETETATLTNAASPLNVKDGVLAAAAILALA